MLSDLAVVLTTVLLLLIPGAAVAVSLGLRPATTLTAAPALTVGLVAAAGTIASFVSLPWNPAAFLGGTALLCAAIVGARLAWRRRRGGETPVWNPPRRPTRSDLIIGAGVAVGWVVSGTVLLRAFGSLGNLNQDWDYVFHANAVRIIADTNDVDPAALRAINGWELQDGFYPNVFHGFSALVYDITGAPVFAVLNAQSLMVAGVAGLGLAGLLRALRAPTVVTAATPVLLAGFASFPYDILWRGPLLPFAMGIALIPAFFVLLYNALTVRRLSTGLAAGLGAAALLGVQTATALSAALIVFPFLLQHWWTPGRELLRDLRVLVVVGVSAVVLGLPFVTGVLTVTGSGARMDWPAVESVGQAIGDLFALNHAAGAPQYWLAVLLVVGLLTLGRTRYMWWWLAGGGIAAALFVMSAAIDSPLVEAVTAPWWNDRWRFAALAVLAFAPLAASGLFVLGQAADAAITAVRRRAQPSQLRAGVLAAGILTAVAVLSNWLYMGSNEARVAPNYQAPGQLADQEIEAMRWLAARPDAAEGWVMNDPNDGSPYMQALFGLEPVFAHIISPGTAGGEIQPLLLEHFNCLDSSPRLRAAVEDLDIRYVFVGDGWVRQGMTRYPGLEGLDGVQSLDEVYRESGVAIYRVDLTPAPTEAAPACDLPDNP